MEPARLVASIGRRIDMTAPEHILVVTYLHPRDSSERDCLIGRGQEWDEVDLAKPESDSRRRKLAFLNDNPSPQTQDRPIPMIGQVSKLPTGQRRSVLY